MVSESKFSPTITGFQNDLGFRLLHEYLKLQDSFPQKMTNTVLSPLSISTALGIVFNGAAENTRQCIADTLGNSKIDEITLNQALQASTDALITTKGLEIAIANSLWVKQHISLLTDFKSTCQKYFSAQINNLDFSSQDAVETINDWVKQATQGNIQKILEKISPSTVLFIINAVFFKGTWANQFDPERTRTGIFHSLENEEIKCQFMNQSGKYSFLQNEYFKAARLPYQDERFAMILFLPTLRDTLEESISAFQSILKKENWDEWLNQFHDMEGNICVPRIKVDSDMELKATLQALGMAEAFDQTSADFSRMCDVASGLFISDVIHKTCLEVNEEGTVAAAVTKVPMMSRSIAMHFTMILDRPFFFAIHDKESGGLLFIGWIVNPNSSSTK